MNQDEPTEQVREVMRALRSVPHHNGASSAHLDDEILAMLVDGMDPSTNREAVAHLAACSECRTRLTAVLSLLDDSLVAAEIDAVEPQLKRIAPRHWSPARWGAIATLAAAAAVAIVLARPDKLNLRANGPAVSSETGREGTVTTTAPPQIVSPAVIGSDDSLRWTKVPGADQYRVQVWDREGNVIVSTDTQDTVLMLPAKIARVGGSYMWEVKARTGWDRWVSSDFLELNVKPHAR